MDVGSIVGFGINAAKRTVDAAIALPRIARALERLADAADDLRKLADAAPAIEALSAMAADARRLMLDPARYEEFAAALAAIVRIGEAVATMGPLADAVKQLNAAAATLSTTVAPLSGASEFLGRFVGSRPTVDGPATEGA